MSFQEKMERIVALGEAGKVKIVSVAHDDGCPAIRSQSLLLCRCDPDIVTDDAEG